MKSTSDRTSETGQNSVRTNNILSSMYLPSLLHQTASLLRTWLRGSAARFKFLKLAASMGSK
jgi:hypothetical protein